MAVGRQPATIDQRKGVVSLQRAERPSVTVVNGNALLRPDGDPFSGGGGNHLQRLPDGDACVGGKTLGRATRVGSDYDRFRCVSSGKGGADKQQERSDNQKKASDTAHAASFPASQPFPCREPDGATN